jgi:hypothetical protein
MLTKLRAFSAVLLLSGALVGPIVWTEPVHAQEVAPAISDAGPRSGPEPIEPHPMAYGLIAAALAVGIAVGVVAVLVIRGWDRSRPIERQSEEHQRPHPL